MKKIMERYDVAIRSRIVKEVGTNRRLILVSFPAATAKSADENTLLISVCQSPCWTELSSFVISSCVAA